MLSFRFLRTPLAAGVALVTAIYGSALSPNAFATERPSGKAQAYTAITQRPLTLEVAVTAAKNSDIWLLGNRYSQDAIESSSIAAGTLPDPKMTIAFANLPVDNLDFGQEGMTQFKVGFSQMFPRGDSLKLKEKQLALEGQKFPYQRKDRIAKAAVMVSNLWLETYRAKESIALIERDRALFEQLADVAQASYSSGFGKTRQHDIVRAQLEMTRLEDRLTTLRLKQEAFRQKLNEWLDGGDFFTNAPSTHGDKQQSLRNLTLARTLPSLSLIGVPATYKNSKENSTQLNEALSIHPALKALDKKIGVGQAGIEIEEQKYKPAWGINASYAYRDDDSMGNDRADLFSIGVSFDLPIFTSKRQDQQVKAAISKTEAIKTERALLLRKMRASHEALRVQLNRLNERQELYHSILLPQVREQAEASLTAYTNDDGDFAEVVRARIAQLNAGIEELGINVERQKIIANMNYYFAGSLTQQPHEQEF